MTMKKYRGLVQALWRSQRRDSVGLFFSVAFAPVLVIALGLIFGNEPRPEFGGQGFLDGTLPAFASVVLAMVGVLQVPIALLSLRDSGALQRLSLTPLSRSTFMLASQTVHFIAGIVSMIAALAIGIVAFGAFLAVGCALAAIYPSTAAATGIGNVLMILLMLTSGAFTPVEVMPEGIQQIIQYSPVRWFVDGAERAWNGDSISSLAMQLLLLVGLLVVAGTIGRTRFRWEPAR